MAPPAHLASGFLSQADRLNPWLWHGCRTRRLTHGIRQRK